MFSANENLQLRQHKRRVVQCVEDTIPEDVLDLGVNVMVMQVSCQAPGCVPLETAIVIVFPDSKDPLLPDLPESAGGNYKTKVLKPLADVTKEDVLDSLPPAFLGGTRSVQKLSLQARDVMLGQITQLFDNVTSRRVLVEYLKKSLDEFVAHDCQPPEWGQSYPNEQLFGTEPPTPAAAQESASTQQQQSPLLTKTSGNIVIQRPNDDDDDNDNHQPPPPPHSLNNNNNNHSSSSFSINNTTTRRKQQQAAELQLLNTQSLLATLSEEDHSIRRRAGCPCCDPDHPSNIVDRLMQL